MSPDLQRLEHILDYCSDICSLVNRFGDDYDIFSRDTAYQQAVSFCILQIGELANGLSDEFRRTTDESVSWKQIRGMRNVVVHNYGNISFQVLWDTVKNDLPALTQFCKRMLGE